MTHIYVLLAEHANASLLCSAIHAFFFSHPPAFSTTSLAHRPQLELCLYACTNPFVTCSSLLPSLVNLISATFFSPLPVTSLFPCHFLQDANVCSLARFVAPAPRLSSSLAPLTLLQSNLLSPFCSPTSSLAGLLRAQPGPLCGALPRSCAAPGYFHSHCCLHGGRGGERPGPAPCPRPCPCTSRFCTRICASPCYGHSAVSRGDAICYGISTSR